MLGSMSSGWKRVSGDGYFVCSVLDIGGIYRGNDCFLDSGKLVVMVGLLVFGVCFFATVMWVVWMFTYGPLK